MQEKRREKVAVARGPLLILSARTRDEERSYTLYVYMSVDGNSSAFCSRAKMPPQILRVLCEYIGMNVCGVYVRIRAVRGLRG